MPTIYPRHAVVNGGHASCALCPPYEKKIRTGETACRTFEKGAVRIHYEEAGSGYPAVDDRGRRIELDDRGPVGQLSAVQSFEEFKGEYRCIAADLRNANTGQSSGPLEIDRPWDSHTDDHLGLMDHLGIDKFMVLGFCIGGPLIWNLLKRAPDRIVAARAGAAFRLASRDARSVLRQQYQGLGAGAPEAAARHHGGDRPINS